jgi:hypothetical protein
MEHNAPVSRWRRLKRVLVIVLALLAIGAVGWFILWLNGQDALERAIAEADRLDPGWRWEELQAKRPELTDDENAVLQMQKVLALLPGGWSARIDALARPNVTAEEERLRDLSLRSARRNLRLLPEQVAALKRDLEAVGEARGEAHKLAHLPRGRLPAVNVATVLVGPYPLPQQCREVGNLLCYDAILRAEEGDLPGALVAIRGGIHAGQAFADEPLLIVQLIHGALVNVALDTLERVLAQGEAEDGDLAALQQDVEALWRTNSVLAGLRGERAVMFAMDRDLLKVAGGPGVPRNPLTYGWEVKNQALLLERMNAAVEAAKLAPMEQRAFFRNEDRELRKLASRTTSRLAHLYEVLAMPATLKVVEAAQRNRAHAGCALLAVAAERFRRQEGRWPTSLEELTKLVKELPVDPYDGKPFKLKRTSDGLIIYSVGQDEKDNGGTLDRNNPVREGADVGFQLWDVPERRQPVTKTVGD